MVFRLVLLKVMQAMMSASGPNSQTCAPRRIPAWVKIAYTVFVAVLVPEYLRFYGPANFLWFCDIALLLTVPALWLESRFLASMQLVRARYRKTRGNWQARKSADIIGRAHV